MEYHTCMRADTAMMCMQLDSAYKTVLGSTASKCKQHNTRAGIQAAQRQHIHTILHPNSFLQYSLAISKPRSLAHASLK